MCDKNAYVKWIKKEDERKRILLIISFRISKYKVKIPVNGKQKSNFF